MRLRLWHQRVAIWREGIDAAHWIATGEIQKPQESEQIEDDPAVLIGREQVRKDGGRLIVENVNRAIEQWRAKTLKPDEPM